MVGRGEVRLAGCTGISHPEVKMWYRGFGSVDSLARVVVRQFFVIET